MGLFLILLCFPEGANHLSPDTNGPALQVETAVTAFHFDVTDVTVVKDVEEGLRGSESLTGRQQRDEERRAKIISGGVKLATTLLAGPAGRLTHRVAEMATGQLIHRGMAGTLLHDPLAKIAHFAGLNVCFAVGTPIRNGDGSKLIENVVENDWVLGHDESNPAAPVRAYRVEELFVGEALICEVTVGGQVIGVTAAHPFFVSGQGWRRCDELALGDRIETELGLALPLESVRDTGRWETVYNLRIADAHTYFVGAPEWGFALWVHNSCLAPIHHIATNKSIKTGWTAQFEAIFAKAGMTLNHKYNKTRLPGHSGRHSTEYHKHILQRLRDATGGESGRSYRAALIWELRAIKNQLRANPGMIRGIGLI